MKVELTKEQQAAVDASVSENLVSAAAGSGKTKVLSERIVKRLTSGDTSIDRLLIVTFTRAAASQMREKISEAVEAELKKNFSKKLQRQLSLIPGADICTIDSFCINLVRQNFFKVNVPPDFTLADENEMIILREEVVCDVLEELYEEGSEGFLSLVRTVGKGKNDEALKEMILKVYSFSRAFEDPEKWLDEALSCHEKGSEKNNMLYGELIGEIKDALCEIKDMLSAGLMLTQGAVDTYAEVFFKELELFEKCFKKDEISESDFDSFEFGRFSSKKTDPAVSEMKSTAKALHDDAKTLFEKVRTAFGMYESERGISYKKIEALICAVKKYAEKYMEEKLLRKELEFSDCEYFALKLLEENEETAEELRKKYDEIYIDEYQDTNPLQDKLFSTISRKAWGEANLFIVGDIKQSIYRFRHSDPTLFGQKAKTFGQDEKSRKMILSKNFRSREIVLDSINCVFDKIMRDNTAQIEYRDGHQLYFGGSFPEYDQNKSELYILDGTNIEDDDLKKEEMEALVVAQKIRDMIDGGFMVSENGSLRKMKYSDVAVLARAISGKADRIVKIFSLMDVPVYCETSQNFFDATEIRIVISLLKSVDNPLCDIPLAALMRSPIFSFDENELLEIRRTTHVPFFENVTEKAIEESSLGEKCRAFLEKLNEWRELSGVISVERFVSRVIDESGYFSFVGALPGGFVRQENLRHFISFAADYEKTRYKGLYNFVRYIDKTLAKGGIVETKTDPGEDSVLITTIHKSKGLEFPVVFVIGCGNKFNEKDSTNAFILDPRGGIALVERDVDRRIKFKTAEYNAISQIIKKENHAEQQRLLYVAMTRAKEKLIMVGTETKLENRLDKWESYRSGKVMSDYTVRNITKYLDYVAGAIDFNFWDFFVIDTLPPLVELEEEKEKTGKENKIVPQAICQLSYSYPYEGIMNIPAKMSVSEIKKMSMDTESVEMFEREFKKVPDFMVKEKKLTGAMRGNAYHHVAELISPFEKDVEKAINALKEEKLITEAEAECIDVKKFEKLLDSPVGQYLREAEHIYREESFTMSIPARDVFPEGGEESIIVQGTIDCLVKTKDGKFILIDYKTDFYNDKEEVAQKYKKQLDLYEIAVFNAFGQKCEKKCLYLFHKDDIIYV